MTDTDPREDLRGDAGKPIRTFHGRRVTWNDFFLWVLPGALVPLALLAAGTFARITGFSTGSLQPQSWFVLAAIALIPYGALTLQRFSSARKSVTLCKNGLLLRNISSGQRTLLWSQISALRTGGTRYHFFGLPVSDAHALTIEPVHGKKVHLQDDILEVSSLAQAVKRRVYPLLYESMVTEMQLGHPLHFGAVAIDSQHFHVRGKRIAWENVGAIRVEDGALHFESDGQRQSQISTHKIENLELLLRIIERHFSTTG